MRYSSARAIRNTKDSSSEKNFSGESGIGKITLIVFGLIIGVAFFCAYHILPFYYYFYSLQEQMTQLARVASVHNDDQLRQKLAAHLKRYEIPADAKDLKIERVNNIVRMSLDYEEVFGIEWQGEYREIHVFEFNAFAEEEID